MGLWLSLMILSAAPAEADPEAGPVTNAQGQAAAQREVSGGEAGDGSGARVAGQSPEEATRETTADYLVLPEWAYDGSQQSSRIKRGAGTAAAVSYSFLNDTISDTWLVAKSPLDWRLRGWATFGAVAGVTTGMIFLVDDRVRMAGLGNESFQSFGENIRWLGTGPGLAALTGGFAAAGWIFDRPKERETARLLLEASAVGFAFNLTGKYTFGRSRPRTGEGPESFDPFSGAVSMPSGEATGAFIMAGVITSQYPQWPVQIAAYSLATAVGVGRIALDAHWTSDVFLSAALGVAVSKAVVHFNRKRSVARRQALRVGRKPDFQRHYFQVSTRSLRWTYIF